MVLKFGSPAWQRKFNPRFRKRKINKHKHSIRSMPKKRRGFAKRRTGRRSGSRIGVMGVILGTVGYIVFDAVIKPFIPLNPLILSVAELGLGFYLSKSKTSWVKYTGLAMVFINLFVLAKTYVSPVVNNLVMSIAH